jgi:hypothetical protein
MDLQKYLIGLHFKCINSNASPIYKKNLITMYANNVDTIHTYLKAYLENYCKQNNYVSYKLYSYDIQEYSADVELYMKSIYF